MNGEIFSNEPLASLACNYGGAYLIESSLSFKDSLQESMALQLDMSTVESGDTNDPSLAITPFTTAYMFQPCVFTIIIFPHNLWTVSFFMAVMQMGRLEKQLKKFRSSFSFFSNN